MWHRVCAALLCMASGASAHEFWIDPLQFQVTEGGQLQADLRVGQDFSGAVYSYVPPRFSRFDLVMGDDVWPVTGRAGDRPALNNTAPKSGLVSVVHVTQKMFVTYTEWEKFVAFTTEKGYPKAADQHRQRGLPQAGFKERYWRFGKSLIAVGDGAGADRDTGMLTEIVALNNPYTDDLSAGISVQILYQGAPRSGAVLDIFAKDSEGRVNKTVVTADENGIATVPVMSGNRYLLDSVVLLPLDEEGAVWESFWASLTFAVP